MASTYVNNLRLNEMATGDESGNWGVVTNLNLELAGEALGYGTEAITTNADTHTSTVADGASDPVRAMYVKYTGTLDSACTITIAPNTMKRVQFIENGTSGSQNIIISQGSGANITIPPGDTKVVYLDGAGSGAAVVDAFASLSVVDLKVQDDLTVTDDMTVGGTLGVTGIVTLTDDLIIGDGKTIGSASDVDAMTIASNGQVTFSQTLIGTALDISGDIDVDGTTNLDVVDIDGTTETDVLTINGSQFNYKAFGTSSIMIGDTTTGTIDAADGNTGLGVDVFAALTSGDNNTAIGKGTMGANTTGVNNTAVGQAALDANTTGINNVAVGWESLGANTDTSYNTALGWRCLEDNTASDNTGVGAGALRNNTSGTNVGVGKDALTTNTTGTRNTAVGYNALDAVDTTNDHTAVGYNALTACTSGGANTAVGTQCADAVTSGDDNTAMGNLALSAATTVDDNTAIGSGAMRYSTGASNTAVGKSALGASSNSGDNNTIVGAGAGISFTSASNNTCIGKGAGNNQTTGGQNTFVGENARGSAVGTEVSIVLGYNTVGQGDYYTTLGSGAGSDRIYNQFSANASWTRVSDSRYKEEITNNTDCGLSFINDLRPVTFKFKPLADIDNTLPDYDASKNSRLYDKKMYGLIAQEVKQAMDDNNITDFAGWDQGDNGIQGISQEMFIHPLIKAVQELTALNTALTTRIEALEG